MENLDKLALKKEDFDWVTQQVIDAEARAFRKGFFNGASTTIEYVNCDVPVENIANWVYCDVQDWQDEGKGPVPEIKNDHLS